MVESANKDEGRIATLRPRHRRVLGAQNHRITATRGPRRQRCDSHVALMLLSLKLSYLVSTTNKVTKPLTSVVRDVADVPQLDVWIGVSMCIFVFPTKGDDCASQYMWFRNLDPKGTRNFERD